MTSQAGTRRRKTLGRSLVIAVMLWCSCANAQTVAGTTTNDVPLDSLKLSDYSARHHPPGQIAQLMASIEQCGMTIPLVVDKEGYILAGHGRWPASRNSFDQR